MEKLETRIVDLLTYSPKGMKARDLAEYLHMDKSELNKILYGKLEGTYLYVDDKYVWHAYKLKAIRKATAYNELPKNSGKKWTVAEKNKLMDEYRAEMPMIEIAGIHERTELSIAYQIIDILRSDKRYSEELKSEEEISAKYRII